MKEGDYEGWMKSDKYPGSRRYFSLYTDEEFRNVLEPHFKIIHQSKFEIGEARFLNYFCFKIN